jgi:hypothetical protein
VDFVEIISEPPIIKSSKKQRLLSAFVSHLALVENDFKSQRATFSRPITLFLALSMPYISARHRTPRSVGSESVFAPKGREKEPSNLNKLRQKKF